MKLAVRYLITKQTEQIGKTHLIAIIYIEKLSH